MQGLLQIPGDRLWARITSPSGDVVHYEGDEFEAYRISAVVLCAVGGNMWTESKGALTLHDDGLTLLILGGAGMGTFAEIEIRDGRVRRASILYD